MGITQSAELTVPLLSADIPSGQVLAAQKRIDVLQASTTNSPSAANMPAMPKMRPACRSFRKPTTAQPTQMRQFFKMLVLLIDLFDASHLFWSPARLWSDAAQFRAAIAEMLASGMPPVLHLVAFRRREDAGGASMGTRGLALFGGQELEARIPEGWTVADMVKRLSRLALDMMLNGPVRHGRTMRGLESGEWIDLSPSPAAGGQRSSVIVEFGRDR